MAGEVWEDCVGEARTAKGYSMTRGYLTYWDLSSEQRAEFLKILERWPDWVHVGTWRTHKQAVSSAKLYRTRPKIRAAVEPLWMHGTHVYMVLIAADVPEPRKVGA